MATAPEKHFPLAAFAVIVLLCAVVASAFVFKGKFFKSAGDQTGAQTNPITATPNVEQSPPPVPPKPVPELASVVFGKGDSLVLGSGTNEAEVEDPAKAAFLAAFKADLAAPLAFAGPLPLTTHTGVGRDIPTAIGDVRYHKSFPGGVVIGVTLDGLVPNHEYVLTLNGAVQHAGNGNLPDQLSRNNPQKFYDFSRISTDMRGSYQAIFGIRLPPGPYDVYFFVKDTADWKIVLGHELFQFTVK